MSGCCKVPSDPADLRICPRCGTKGRVLRPETPLALLEEEARGRLGPGPHFYCPSPTCEVVYFCRPGQPVIVKGDLRVRVGQKETDPPVTVCYCFGYTLQSIEDEVQATGRTTVIERIKAEVKAGTCRCEVKNPQGSCCLGNVTRAVSDVRRRLGPRLGQAGAAGRR